MFKKLPKTTEGLSLTLGILFGSLISIPLNTLFIKCTTFATWAVSLTAAAILSGFIFTLLVLGDLVWTFILSDLLNKNKKLTSEERKLGWAFVIGIAVFTGGRLPAFTL